MFTLSTHETIDIRQFEDFLEKLKFVFQEIFPEIEKIENIVQLVNNSFSLMPDGVWASEVANVLKSNKSAVQLEISEFQEDVLKNIYAEVPKTLGND